MTEPKHIAIIGAGAAGMTAALDLKRAGYEVSIFEASDHVAGLAAGFKDPNWEWSVEQFYHHWFGTDSAILELMDELGLRKNVYFPRPYTVVYYKDKFYPFDSILNALLYPGLGYGINKIRFGLVGLYLRLTNNWKSLERYTVDEWMRKWAGDKVYEEMWEPMVIGKFGENYAKQINMAWFWARLHARTTRLGTYEGGFQAFFDHFAEQLRLMGVKIHLSSPIDRIHPNPDGTLGLDSKYGRVNFDQVLVTSSPTLFSRLAPDLPSGYLKGLLELKSMGAVVMVLALKKQLSSQGYYWYNIPKSAGFPFLSLVEHTNFVSPKHFGGDHIVYIGDYLEPTHEYFSLSKEELLQRFLPVLSRFNPDFQPDWIRESWLFSTPYAQPIPLANHSQNIPAIQTPIKNLYFASMSQVYPWDRGTNFAVEIGRRAARMIIQDDTSN